MTDKINSITLYIDVFPRDDKESSCWARITIDEAFVERVRELQKLCIDHGLSSTATATSAVQWEDKSMNTPGQTLHVSRGEFWIASAPRHDYSTLTWAVDLQQFEIMLQAALKQNPNSYMRRADLSSYIWQYENGAFFYSPNGYVNELIEMTGNATEDEDDDSVGSRQK